MLYHAALEALQHIGCMLVWGTAHVRHVPPHLFCAATGGMRGCQS